MALVAEVLVCDISNYGDVSIPPFAYCKMQRSTLLVSAPKSRLLNLPDRRQRSFLTKIGALYWSQGLRFCIMWSDNCDVFCINSICVLCDKTKVCAKKISQTMANLGSHFEISHSMS